LPKRDSQRQRLYTAEQTTRIWHDESIGSGFDIELRAKLCSTFANEVMKRKYVQRKYPKATMGPVHVEISKGAYAYARAVGGHTIKLPSAGLWAYTKLVMLHELAHIIEHRENGSKYAWHDWPFAAIFLDLVRNVMGKEAHDHLKRQFRLNRVRFKPKAKRTLTPEQREAARLRMTKARAVRDANIAFRREACEAFEPVITRTLQIGKVKGVPVEKYPSEMNGKELAELKARIKRYEADRVREAMHPFSPFSPDPNERWRDFVYDTMLDLNRFRPTSFITVTDI
jgi:putative metallohydrolase (TIGR04338 family)